MYEVDFGLLYVMAVSADRAVPAHHIVTHTTDVTDAAPRPFHSLFKDFKTGISHERSVKQSIALGTHHSVVHERVTGDRQADGQVTILDSRVGRTVHRPSNCHHVAVQQSAAELPEQHQLHSELGERGTLVEAHGLERRKLQHIVQVDVHHIQPVVAVLVRQVDEDRQQ